MKLKNSLKKIALLTLCLSFALSGASCTMFSTDNVKDMEQVVANVDITNHTDFKAGGKYADYAEAIKSYVVTEGEGEILKRDLVSYFLNVGSTYIQNYGYSYKDTFNMLLNTLVSRKLVVQYAMAYYLSEYKNESDVNPYSVADLKSFIDNELNSMTDKTEQELVEKHASILAIKYFITENGTDTKKYDEAVYNLKKSVNSALDSSEKNYITAQESKTYESFGDRTTPTNVGTEKSDYLPDDYEIYTGNNSADACGDYKKLDGSTKYTRRQAYNDFLSNLASNNMIGKKEKTVDFTKTDYYYVELTSQLEQALITMYSEQLTATANSKLTNEYISQKYTDLLEQQKNNSATEFESAIGGLSDESFVLYSPMNGFGFVYNILLPFGETDSKILSTYSESTLSEKKVKYAKRAELLQNVKAKDLRAGWFSNDKDASNAYVASGEYYKNTYLRSDDGTDYLFFEDNFTNSDRYENLKQYLGKYPYNGNVIKTADGEYSSFAPNEMDIDDFIAEFENYIGYCVGDPTVATGNKLSSYVTDPNTYTIVDGDFKYSEFMYYKGNVALSDTQADVYFNADSDAYKAVSAVNELMFAYSTDPGCLNQYMGYAVSPITDKYVPEFAYAAQDAVGTGVGTYVVCPSTYGWHIIYVNAVYSNETYSGYVDADREKEGTFSNLWYEYIKSATEDEYTNNKQNSILDTYTELSTTYYTSRYQDLLDLK